MKKALVIGDVYLETQYFVEDIPSEEEFTFSNNILQRAGSKTLNSARALLALGYDVDFYGLVGHDPASDLLISYLDKYSISRKYIQKKDADTGSISVTTNSDGESSIVLFSGANAGFNDHDVQKVLEIINNYDFVYTSTNFKPEYLYELTSQNQRKFFIDFPNNHDSFELSRFGDNVWLMPNRRELGLLAGKKISSVKIAKESLKNLTAESEANFLVTLDSDGAIATDGKKVIMKSIIEKYKEVDSIGLGDIFRAVFAFNLSNNKSIGRSIELSNATTSPLVQVKGIDDKIDEIKR